MTDDFKEKIRQRIADASLMDDEFFRICMKDNIPAVQLILRIILDDDKLIVESMKTQEDMKNLFGKSSWFDIHAIDKNDRHMDVEIQNANAGAGRKRARYYSSLLDANISAPGKDYEELPDNLMIMLAKRDVLKGNLPLYHIKRVIEETGEEFSDGSYIIFVNGQYRGNDPLGQLMKDFHEKEADKIYYEVLKDRAGHFKNMKEGGGQMSEEFEALAKEYAEELLKPVEEELAQSKEEIAKDKEALAQKDEELAQSREENAQKDARIKELEEQLEAALAQQK